MGLKSAKIQLVLEWEITKKDWLEEIQHLSDMDKLDSVITKDDVIHTLFALNDMAYPVVKRTSIK